MSNKKSAAASKRARNARKSRLASKGSRPKVATRAQRNKQALVRSPKSGPPRSVAADSTGSPMEVHDDPKRETPTFEKRAAGLEAMLQVALQDGFGQKARDNNPWKGDLSLLIANMQAHQLKLLEIAQANVQFVLEFSQRLATSRSPFDFLGVIAEFTGRRIMMTGKHSRELAALYRIDAFRELRALPGR